MKDKVRIRECAYDKLVASVDGELDVVLGQVGMCGDHMDEGRRLHRCTRGRRLHYYRRNGRRRTRLRHRCAGKDGLWAYKVSIN